MNRGIDENIAELLLDQPATAVFTPDNVLIAANYHTAHSEGYFKTIVQDVKKRKGPWVLFNPPGAGEKTFYLQDLVFPFILRPQFSPSVENARKIDYALVYQADPSDVFDQFRAMGYTFVDMHMTEEHYDRLVHLSERARSSHPFLK